MTTYAWEKKESAGSWVPFEGTPTAQNPSEDFDAGTWSVRETVTDGLQVGSKTRIDYISVSAAPSYTGPLDLVPGAVVAFGQRALSTAKLGTALYTIIRDSDETTQSFSSDAVTGAAPSASISSFIGSNFNRIGAVVDTTDTIVLTSSAGVAVGQVITGTDIPAGTYVLDISAAPTIQISQAAIGTNAAETLTLTPNGKVFPLVDQSGNGLNAGTIVDSSLAYPVWRASQFGTIPGLISTGPSFRLSTDEVPFPGGAFTMLLVVYVDVSVNPPDLFLMYDSTTSGPTLSISCGYNADFDISLIINDIDGANETVWVTASELTTGSHLIEVKITAVGVVTIKCDGVDMSASIDSGSQRALTVATVIYRFPATSRLLTRWGEGIIWNSVFSTAAVSANMQAYYGTPALP